MAASVVGFQELSIISSKRGMTPADISSSLFLKWIKKDSNCRSQDNGNLFGTTLQAGKNQH